MSRAGPADSEDYCPAGPPVGSDPARIADIGPTETVPGLHGQESADAGLADSGPADIGLTGTLVFLENTSPS